MDNNEPNWRGALWRSLIAGLVLSGAGSRPPGPAELEIVNALLKQWPSPRRDEASDPACCGSVFAPCCAGC